MARRTGTFLNAESRTRNPKPGTQNTETPRVSVIVAMAKNRVIGAKGAIPWHLPNDMRLFRSHTVGHHLIMGRKTYESIGRLLPGRTSVIVTRQADYRVPGALVAHSLEEALAACRDDSEIFVIGGADLYAQALPHADRLYLTTVDAQVDGDTYMPEFDLGAWREISAVAFAADARNPHPFRFTIYERIRSQKPEVAADECR